MKSYGGIWQQITNEDNLREAWRKVRRAHASSAAVMAYERELETNLRELGEEFRRGEYVPRGYRQFRVFDPKPRTISCAPVRDRVVHHALCRVITPLLEKSFVPVSFACRKGFGAHAACALAQRKARGAKYFCKMDVRHFFDTINHDILLGKLLPIFREKPVRVLIEAIVRHPLPGQQEGMGLPIGNLTSQWFANFYLNELDHAVLAGLGGTKPNGYLRYMDDFVVFCDSKAEAWRFHDAIADWLCRERGVALKDEATVVAPVNEGLPFLGLRIFPGCWRLKRERFRRTRQTFRKRLKQHREGVLSEERLSQCAASLDGAVRWFGFKGILDDLVVGEGSSSGSNRVLRGGSWNNNANNCTSSYRNNNNPSNDNNNNGFRLSSTLRVNCPGQTGSHPAKPASGNDSGTNMAIPSSMSKRNHSLKVDGRDAYMT